MRQITKGSTDQSVVIRIIDSADGTPETGVVFNTAGIDLWYRREGAVKTSITEATLSALNDAHSDGGVLHIGDGYYRLDSPDAAFATGAGSVLFGGAVTGMVVIGCEIELVDAKQTGDNYAIVNSGTHGNAALKTLIDTVDNFVDTEIAAIISTLGTPAGASVSADVAAVKSQTAAIETDTQDIQTKIGTPAGASVSVDVAAVKTQTAAIETDTQDIQGRLPAALTGGGNIKSDALAISGDTTAADRLEALMDGIIVAQVNDVGATTTTFIADGFTEATNDHFNGRLITFIGGVLDGQQTAITDYVGATQTFVVTALTEAPANDQFFVIH